LGRAAKRKPGLNAEANKRQGEKTGHQQGEAAKNKTRLAEKLGGAGCLSKIVRVCWEGWEHIWGELQNDLIRKTREKGGGKTRNSL